MTNSTEQQEVVTQPAAEAAPEQSVFTADTPAAGTTPVVVAPTDPAEIPPADPVDPANDSLEPPALDEEPTADKAQAVADANSTATRETVSDEDLSIGQQVAAQIARAKNALEHLEETATREVHAALAEIRSLLGLVD